MISYLAVGALVGLFVGWLVGRSVAFRKIADLEKEMASLSATSSTKLEASRNEISQKESRNNDLEQTIKGKDDEILILNKELSQVNASAQQHKNNAERVGEELQACKNELKTLQTSLSENEKQLALANAQKHALNDKLDTQKQEMEVLNKKFNTEFENIANKILETKTEKFTQTNKVNIEAILKPFEKDIMDFKAKVEETYSNEARERFSLGERVKELLGASQKLSQDANNLTSALKGESKTQGGWGEMILESILEKSGLVRGREYFMEEQLTDREGNPLRSDYEGRKMRPDAIVKYPGDRWVIIDSKVSLNAFLRSTEANSHEEKKAELQAHVAALKVHIKTLSQKGYDGSDKSLDFVMMFVPSESAYNAAMQEDPELWSFAYGKDVLLLGPTNLIISLKLILNLWTKEYQNQNAKEIAERGAKLYDKFAAFVDNLKGVGDHIQKAQYKYDDAYKQLSTGNDNLILQVEKLKELGLKTKKNLVKSTPDLPEETAQEDVQKNLF